MGLSRFFALALFSCAFVLILLIPSYAQNSQQAYLSPHNSARAAVGVGRMTWDNTVEAYAQRYANKRKGDCRLVPSRGRYGENLFSGRGRVFTAADAVRSWVGEKRYYHYNSNTCDRGRHCGYYTQVVWRESVRIGCARVRCDNGGWFIICNYSPKGNIVGRRPY